MSVPLSEEFDRFVRDQVATGRYGSEEEVVRDVRACLQERAQARPAAPDAAPVPGETLDELIDRLTADVPDEEWARLPTDGAEQHDHYLYGTPKRPS